MRWRLLIAAGTVASLASGACRARAQDLEPARPGQAAPLRQQLAERVGQFVKRQLDLSDDQYRRLVEVNRRYAEPRRLLVEQERDARMGIRDELLRDQPDQPRVDRLLRTMVDIQRQRIEIFEREQRDLAAFLTPVQRAKYAAIQEQIRKRVQQMQQRRRARVGGAAAPDE